MKFVNLARNLVLLLLSCNCQQELAAGNGSLSQQTFEISAVVKEGM
jgi:hypothetical protein